MDLREMYLAVAESYYGPERYARQLGLFDAPRATQVSAPIASGVSSFDADRQHRAKLRSDIDAGIDIPDTAFGRHNDLRELSENRRRQRAFIGGDKYDIGAAQVMPEGADTVQQYGVDAATKTATQDLRHPHAPAGGPTGGQFVPTASTAKPARTPLAWLGSTGKPKDPTRSWKLAEGATRDLQVVEKIVRRARAKGYEAEVVPQELASGAFIYQITVYGKKGQRMTNPHEFYELEAATEKYRMFHELARAYYGPERYAQMSLFDRPTGGAEGSQPALDWVRKTGERGKTYWFNRVTNPMDKPAGRLYQDEPPTMAQEKSVSRMKKAPWTPLAKMRPEPSDQNLPRPSKEQVKHERDTILELVKSGKPVPEHLTKKHPDLVRMATYAKQQQDEANHSAERAKLLADVKMHRQVDPKLLAKHPDVARIAESIKQQHIRQTPQAQAAQATPKAVHNAPTERLKSDKGEAKPRSGHVGFTEYPGENIKYRILNENPGGIPTHHDVLETRLQEEDNELYRISIVGTSSGKLYSHIEVADIEESSPGHQTVKFRPATKDEATVIASKTSKRSPVAALEREMWVKAKQVWHSKSQPKSAPPGAPSQKSLFTMADSFAAAFCEKYAPRWTNPAHGFRKQGSVSSGQRSFDFAADDNASILRQWDFADEVNHPRGAGSRWVRKNLPEQTDKPAPLFEHERIDDIAKSLSSGDKDAAIKSIGGERIDQKTAKQIMAKMGLGEQDQQKKLSELFYDVDMKRMIPAAYTRRFVDVLYQKRDQVAEMYSCVARAYYGPERYARQGLVPFKRLRSSPGQLSLFDDPKTIAPQSSGDWVRKQGAQGSTYWFNRRTNPNDNPEGRKYQEHPPSESGEVSAPVSMKHREVNPLQAASRQHKPIDLDALGRTYKYASTAKLDRLYNDFATAMSQGDRSKAEQIYGTDKTGIRTAIRNIVGRAAANLGISDEHDIEEVSDNIGLSLFDPSAKQHDLTTAPFSRFVYRRAHDRFANVRRSKARRPDSTTFADISRNDPSLPDDERNGPGIEAEIQDRPHQTPLDAEILKPALEAFLDNESIWHLTNPKEKDVVRWVFGIDSPTGEPVTERNELARLLAKQSLRDQGVDRQPTDTEVARNRKAIVEPLLGTARPRKQANRKDRRHKPLSQGGTLAPRLSAFLKKHQGEYEQLLDAMQTVGVNMNKFQTAATKYAAAYLLVKYMARFDEFHAQPERFLLHELRVQPERYVFGQFDPAKHERHGKGDPEGKGGQFAPKHGASPAGTQGVEMPQPPQPNTGAFSPAAPPVPKLTPAAKPQKAQMGGGVQTAIALALLAAGILGGKKGAGMGLLAAAAVPHLTGTMRTQARQAKAVLEQDPKSKFGKELAESARRIDAKLKAAKSAEEQEANKAAREAEKERRAEVAKRRNELAHKSLDIRNEDAEARRKRLATQNAGRQTVAEATKKKAEAKAKAIGVKSEADLLAAKLKQEAVKHRGKIQESDQKRRELRAKYRDAKAYLDVGKMPQETKKMSEVLDKMVGPDKALRLIVRKEVADRLKDVQESVVTHNNAIDSILGVLDRKEGQKFISKLRTVDKRGGDPDQVPGFDIIVDRIDREPDLYPLILRNESGEWSKGEDIEGRLWDTLIDGYKKLPTAADESLISDAIDRLQWYSDPPEGFSPNFVSDADTGQQEYAEDLISKQAKARQAGEPSIVDDLAARHQEKQQPNDQWEREDVGDTWEPDEPIESKQDESVPFSMRNHAHRELYTQLSHAYYGGKV